MQNIIKSQTRLAFIQFVFSIAYKDDDINNLKNEFEEYFHNLSINSNKEDQETKIKFNKNFFSNLVHNYSLINKKEITDNIDKIIVFDRSFDKWDNINKSLMYSILSELSFTSHDKVKIVLNDYLNIAKKFISTKELKMINAILDKYLNEKKIL